MPTVLTMHRLSDCVRVLGQGGWVLVKLCPSESHNGSCTCMSDAPDRVPAGMTMAVANMEELPEAARLCAAPWGSYVLMRGLRQVEAWEHCPGFDQLSDAIHIDMPMARLA